MARKFPDGRALWVDPISNRKICFSCWHGDHWGWEKPTKPRGKKVSHCEHHDCGCSCREFLAEFHPRVKKDLSAQTEIGEIYGTIEVE